MGDGRLPAFSQPRLRTRVEVKKKTKTVAIVACKALRNCHG